MWNMSDKNIMIFILTLLTGTSAYQVLVHPTASTVTSGQVPLVGHGAESIAAVDCQDCLESVPETCETTTDECLDTPSCDAWVVCTESCIKSNGDQDCYRTCDMEHSDVHAECSSMKSCMCDVCIGSCLDFCTTDD